MTSSQLLLEGVELMLFGMGFVFLFLVLLIGAIHLMARVLARIAPAAAAPVVRQASVPVASSGPSADVLAAIQTAIHQHRARRG
ncbi:oxaloacetate decarboxylase, gamma subunit [Pseudomonas cuatrocienegasensis]|uniref:Probable oxaloacetate decarboxylase gamma chain n=1 Tax=Pseudomonas cuatrocienegasensis TaxID=543360 RepID=A0ABY1B0E6_9PSED|nr:MULTISPECIES: OadG family transporter subunit [Pseudomonas]OEC36120.1 oxaloacetate decarboxylase [Pseudomonas sp. 21C1]SEP63029.1 oxaloacetate decarboxylase, gamma subunit [Pseudomonas cuatrocienegasensis]